MLEKSISFSEHSSETPQDVITGRFIVDGLEPARALSSRLSVSTTILITLLAMPGALAYLLSQLHHPHSDP